jgi:hypothetical protein
MAQGTGSEFKFQYHKKKKRKSLGFVPVLLGICFEPLAVSSFVPYGVGLGVSERSLLALKH